MIQGGPGTGKTAVGLHRASWLLYTLQETLARRGVLVVGPNRTFMEYVSHVLPALGEDAVEQRAVDELVDGVDAELRDPPAVAALKADTRLVEVIRRAAELRLESEPRGARAAARRLVHLGARARGARAARGGARRARHDDGRPASGSG